MDKQKALEKLAVHYGIVPEYADKEGKIIKISAKEYQEFLNAIGINTETSESIEQELLKIEKETWENFTSPVQIVKHGKAPLVELRIAESELNQSCEWIIEEETGKYHRGEFYASHLTVLDYYNFAGKSYIKVELKIPIHLNMGYHTLKIRSESGKESSMKLIITPHECYKPLALEKKRDIKGIKYNLFSVNPQSDFKISSYKDLTSAIKYISAQNLGVLSINPISQLNYSETVEITKYPSTKMLFNAIFIDIDELIDFVGDKNLKLELLSEEFQEKLREVQENEEIELNKIYELKSKIFKIIYNSFRENHINNNTDKSNEFFNYISVKNGTLRKLALFEALQEYFHNEDPGLSSWHEWPKDYQNPESEAVIIFEKNNIETVQFYEFLQWQADIQMNKAGRTSWINKLPVGIYTELPYFIDKNGAGAWLNKESYSFNAYTDTGEDSCPPIIPHKLKQFAYDYITKTLKLNMTHFGAIKINEIQRFYKTEWTSGNIPEIKFCVEYPFEDTLGVIALESHKNKCAVYIDDKNMAPNLLEKLEKLGFLKESELEITEYTDETELKTFFEAIQKQQEQDYKEIGKEKRIEFERTPLSVYRIQFNKNFTFKDATNIIPYLKDLGISHCYASPLLRPRKGSMHCYDIIDHSLLNPEIGTMEEFDEFVNTLHHYDMGLIIDIVPNHMGVGTGNKWWMDVLENGQASKFASFFDIDWTPIKKELAGKVLVPILGEHYGCILEKGQFKFSFNEENGKFKLNYWEHEFPINSSSYPTLLEHRLEVLESRLGSTTQDFLEYLSIINILKKIPGINETSIEKVDERNREKDIASKRLAELCRKNHIISKFIQENIVDFECKPDDPVSCNRIHNLLEEQAYRLAYWRVSSDVINYRRFFDVNDLIGVKTESPLVFSSTHGLILDLIEQEKIDGLRLDHPDGLLDPTGYFINLQKEAGKRLGINFSETEESLLAAKNLPIYVVAEKILAPFEKIPMNWAINGTVGYEFLNDVCHLMVNQRAEKKFSRIYQRFIGNTLDFDELVIDCKKLIMRTSLTGELNTLSNLLNRISEKYYSTRDYTLNALRDALTEIISFFPVYRTYITENRQGDKAIDYIKWAVGMAKKRSQSTDPSIFDFIEKVLLLELEENKESDEFKDILKFSLKFQQYTGPLMAKGLEDTSFYRYNRLIALNEVGGEPKHFGMSVSDFHNNNLARNERTPHGLLTTSTHDTKRSEDVRARICALSEVADEWMSKVSKWARINKSKKTYIEQVPAPDKNDEYLFYQTLIGVWPTEVLDESQLDSLIDRIENYMIKAIREAKVHTSWININTAYEEAIKNFIRKTLTVPEQHPFWKEFIPFQKKISNIGQINSLTQTTLKLSSPGVPDIYQGNELTRYSLVDPDNRRPVDYNIRRECLEEIKPLVYAENPENIDFEQMLLPFESGKMKLYLVASLLNLRQSEPETYRHGAYIPLEVTGSKADNIVAFARSYDGKTIITAVPRLISGMISEDKLMPIGDIWKDTFIQLPEELLGTTFTNILDKNIIEPQESCLNVAEIFKTLPVGVLYGER